MKQKAPTVQEFPVHSTGNYIQYLLFFFFNDHSLEVPGPGFESERQLQATPAAMADP